MGNMDSGLADLDWRERGDYPALDKLYKGMTFDDALDLVHSLTGISASDVEVDGLVPMYNDDPLIFKRAEAWDASMKDLLTSDFPAQSSDICVQLSRDLGVISNTKFAEFRKEFSGVASRNPEGLGRLYHLTTLLILLGKRVEFRRVPYVEPCLELSDDLRQKLSGILSGSPIIDANEVDAKRGILIFNHEILQKYRKYFSQAGKYPIERILQQDPEKISEYCYALLRLVLGKSENFSEVLQESFILKEVEDLSQRYFPRCCGGRSLWNAEISEVVGQLRDLGVRVFEHNCLMTCRVPTSGIITPPGRLIGPDTKIAVDFGAGLRGRFFSAMSRGNPGCDFYAVDEKVREESDLRNQGFPNMHFVRGDFSDKFCVERLVSRFGSNIDMVNLSNILHKLKNPVGFLRAIFKRMLREHGGKVNVCMPALSGFLDGAGRYVGMESLVVMGYEDTTQFWESFLTIEEFLDVIRSTSNMRIMSIALADSRLSENDMMKRMFVALVKD